MNKDETLYYIVDPDGNICTSILTYEEVLMWIDSCDLDRHYIKICEVIKMSVNEALIIINGIQRKWYKKPTNYYQSKLNFRFQSYKHSAVDEIKSYLSRHKDQNALELLDEFRHKIDNFACYTKNGEANFMFSVYYDVATDLLDELLRY